MKNSRFSPAENTLVRVEGLEPPSLAAPDPKSGVSANFTTPAFGTAKVLKIEHSTISFHDKNRGAGFVLNIIVMD